MADLHRKLSRILAICIAVLSTSVLAGAWTSDGTFFPDSSYNFFRQVGDADMVDRTHPEYGYQLILSKEYNLMAQRGDTMPYPFNTLTAGARYRMKIAVPPGVGYINITGASGYWALPAMYLGFYDTIQDSYGATSPPLITNMSAVSAGISRQIYPLDEKTSNATVQGTQPKILYMIVDLSQAAAQNVSSISYNMFIFDKTLYNTWVSSGCPGVGCGTVFAVSADKSSLAVGETTQLRAVNGTIASCVPKQTGIVTVEGSTIRALAGGATDITCTSTSGASAAAISVTVGASTPGTFALSPSSLDVQASGTYTLTAQNGAIKACSTDNAAVAGEPTVVSGGASATGTITSGAAANSQAVITCLSTTGATSKATLTVKAPVAAASSLSVAGLSLSKVSSNAANFSVTLNNAATGYWVAFPYSTAAPATPSATQIKAGQDSMGAASAAGMTGSSTISAGVAKEYALTGLTAGTNYLVYFYAEDATGKGTAIVPIGFTTNAISAPVTKAAISVNATGKNDALALTAAIVPASDATDTKAYYVAAVIPSGPSFPTGAVFFLTKQATWRQWTGGAFLPYADGISTTNTIAILDGTLNVSSLIGTELYAGYGIGSDYVVKKVYTINP